jgi:hypothetical protein
MAVRVALDEYTGPDHGVQRGFERERLGLRQHARLKPLVGQRLLLATRGRRRVVVEIDVEQPLAPVEEPRVRRVAKLLEELEAHAAEGPQGNRAARGRVAGAIPAKPPRPIEKRRVETRFDVEGTVAAEHPADPLREDAGPRQRVRVRRGDQTGVAVRGPAADFAAVDDGDLPTGLVQIIGGGDADGAASDYDCLLCHPRFLT